MKRSLILSLLFVFSSIMVFGAYMENVPQRLVQPDGMVINCFATGDEFYRIIHDSAGYSIVKHPQTGYFVYALPLKDSVTHSDYIVGRANPQELGLQKWVRLSAEKITAKRKVFEDSYPSFSAQRIRKATHAGKINNIVIFISFADDTVFSNTTYPAEKQKFNDSSSATAVSVYNFYRTSSYNKFYLETSFYPIQNGTQIVSYHDIYPRSYYSPYDATTNPNGYTSSNKTSREHQMLKRAVQAVSASIPANLNLDYNNDGRVDNVAFILNGNTDGWNDLMWPHRWALYTENISINGKRVYDYNFLIESDNTVGVITHELFHTLGAPDLYHYSDNTITPVGIWDLMASTNRGKPQGLSAYMKYKYAGWVHEPINITTPGTYTLYPANGNKQEKLSYKIPLQNTNEYLLLEYRRNASNSFDSPLPGSGILIYRINPAVSGNAYYDGTNNFDEVYVFRPNGTKTVNGTISSAYFNSSVGRVNFGETTNPAPFLKDGSPIKGIYITNITEAGDSIQFTYGSTIVNVEVDKSQIDFDYLAGLQANLKVTANGAWQLTGIDTSWLSANVLFGDSGTTTITLTTKNMNNLTLERSCVLSVSSADETKQVTVTQKVQTISMCQNYSNQLSDDNSSFVTPNEVEEIAELIGVYDTIVSDSMRILLGNISSPITTNDSLLFTLYNVNRSNIPGTIIKSMKVAVSDLQFNDWNIIRFDEPLVLKKSLAVAYKVTTTNGNRFENINLNRRTSTTMISLLMKTTQWKMQTNPLIALPIEMYVCPKSPSGDYLTINYTNIILGCKAGANATINISSNTTWATSHLPEEILLSQTNGQGNSTLTITAKEANNGEAKNYTFYVRSGSIIHKINVIREAPILYTDKENIILEGNAFSLDTIHIITNANISWTIKQTSRIRTEPTSGEGSQEVKVFAAKANRTSEVLHDTLLIISPNDTFAVNIQQKSLLSIKENILKNMVLYPNPTQTKLNVVLPTTENVSSIEVYNLLGQKINCKIEKNESLISIDVSICASGVYLLKVVNGQDVVVQRFIVE